MNLSDQRERVRILRESTMRDLESLYENKFEQLLDQGIEDKYLARVIQLLLNSKEAAISLLKQEIEAPVITKAPNKL